MITVEYLLPFDTKEGICRDIKSFKSLLESNVNFSFSSNKINFKGSEYIFSVEKTDVQNQECSVFHVTFEISRATDKFRNMLKAFRKTVGYHLKDQIQIVWDGISFEWSKELYPKIYIIENSMRKLISKFMLTKLGIGWHKSAIPKDVKESIKDSSYKPSHSILYEVDFIQLSNFLFKEYSLKEASKLPNVLNNIVEDGFNESLKEEILEYIPKNNWDRYFSDLVSLESEELKKQWELLYEIRIKVAHNKSLNLEEYKRALKLCKDLEKTVSDALSKIDRIEIPEEKKESISLKTIGTINEPTGYFVNEYFGLNDSFSSMVNSISGSDLKITDSGIPLSTFLKDKGYMGLGLSKELCSDLGYIDSYRNNLITDGDYLTIKNNINPEIFSTAKAGLNSAFSSGVINLDNLNASLNPTSTNWLKGEIEKIKTDDNDGDS